MDYLNLHVRFYKDRGEANYSTFLKNGTFFSKTFKEVNNYTHAFLLSIKDFLDNCKIKNIDNICVKINSNYIPDIINNIKNISQDNWMFGTKKISYQTHWVEIYDKIQNLNLIFEPKEKDLDKYKKSIKPFPLSKRKGMGYNKDYKCFTKI